MIGKILRVLASALVVMMGSMEAKSADGSFIEVSGTATISIVPDRITVEIGMEEYYVPAADGDSALGTIGEIERRVRRTLKAAGVADSSVIVSDMGNYLNRERSNKFLMGKRLSVTLSDFNQLDDIASKIGSDGICSFRLSRIDNSDMERYNRQGLKAALDAAREKAEFIAGNERLVIAMPYEIIENGPYYSEMPMMSNVAFDGSSSGMESMRRILRKYSVKVRYLFNLAP